jgi:hypothetical protein
MKRLIPSPATAMAFLFPIILFIVRKKRKAGVIYLLATFVLCLGCFENYFHTNSRQSISDTTLLNLQKAEKHFAVYLENGVYTINNIKINEKIIDADVEPLADYYKKFINPEKESNRYKKRDEENVFNEVQIYAKSHKLVDTAHLSLPMSSITRVDVFTKDKGRTNTNHVLSGIGLGLGIGLLVLLIAAAASCNCPQVYTYDGNAFQFKSGVFSGAIYSSLERTDWLPLDSLVSTNGQYQFRVMNNQEEEQFINQVSLMKISHDAQTHVLLDRHGIIHTFQRPLLPRSTSLASNDAGQILSQRDGKSYQFTEKHDSSSVFGSVILDYDKPSNAKEAKLIINAKNTMWGGYIFNDFSSLFGTKYQKYQSRQDKGNREKLDRWQKDQALALMVYVETDKGWRFVDYFPTTGNTAGRDMIMHIKLPENSSDKIRIKLESAFMFWELDYASIDFSADQQLVPELIPASSALKSNSAGNELAKLASSDDQYSKLKQNEFLSIDFAAPEQKGTSSYFLVSSGYYHSLKNYEGKPDIGMLKKFKKKGYFSEFSEKRFDEVQGLLAKGVELKGK